jgi:hypothetical protein
MPKDKNSITVDMDTTCKQCGENGACKNGFCLSCNSERMAGKTGGVSSSMRIRAVKIDRQGRLEVRWQEKDERGEWVGRAVKGAGGLNGEFRDGMNRLAVKTAEVLDVGGKHPDLSVALAGLSIGYPTDEIDTNRNATIAVWLGLQKGDKSAKVTAPPMRSEPRKGGKLRDGDVLMSRQLWECVEIVRDCAVEYVKEHGKA